jgi:hypothetical protein
VAALDQPAPYYTVFDLVRDRQAVADDSVLLDLSGPLRMDPFTVAAAASP